MNTLLHDLRYGLRMLAKAPGVTIMALLALAFGIGANTAIFSVVNTVLLRPLPFKDTDRLLKISLVHQQLGPRGSTLSPSDFLDFKAHNQGSLELATVSTSLFNYSGGETPEQVLGAWTSAGFISTLGVPPLLGRGFLPHEDKPDAERVVMLSEGFWRNRFNADPQIIGRQITLSGRQYTIVGVMPARFEFPERGVQFWAVLPLEPPTHRGPYYMHGILRFPAPMSIEQARTELAQIAARVKAATPALPPDYGYISMPLSESLVGDVRPALLVLLGAVGLVLLIASLNVANLLLSRAAARGKEISIRVALGASRSRIVRQFLTENLLLALAGGIAGLLLSFWGIDLLRAFGPDNVPRLQDVTVDRWVLGWTALISLGSGILFGLAPAWHGTRMDLNNSLKEGGRSGTESTGARRLRSFLVVTEIALAMMLLVGAGLLIRSFVQLQQVRPGFQTGQLLTMQVPLPRAKYTENAQVVSFYDRLLTQVAAVPGVRSAAISSSLPPNGLQVTDTFNLDGVLAVEDAKAPLGSVLFTSPGYFRTLGVPILHGRDFTERDNASAPLAVIVNETLARKYYGNDNPVGKRLKVGGTDRTSNPWMEILGVVGDVKYEGLDTPTAPAYYMPFLQNPIRGMNLVVSASLAPAALAAAIRAEVRNIDPEIPVARVSTMEQLIDKSVAEPRFRTFLIGAFSSLAMLLAAIGIYGVVAYSVSQRTQEIGIRMALGAQPRDVLALVLKQGLSLTLAGVGIGLLGAFALTRVIANLLFGVGPTDPLTFAVIVALLILIALLACYIPARKAAKLNPMNALARGA
ncbi:MAG: ABC transporter permease [Chthoniobacterales bacterium]